MFTVQQRNGFSWLSGSLDPALAETQQAKSECEKQAIVCKPPAVDADFKVSTKYHRPSLNPTPVPALPHNGSESLGLAWPWQLFTAFVVHSVKKCH